MAKKRRLPFIIGLVAIFLVCWLVYMVVIFQSTSRLFLANINERIEDTSEYLEKSNALELTELARNVYMELDGAVAKVESVAAIAGRLGPDEEGRLYFVADSTGMLSTEEGATGQRLSPDALTQADETGSHTQGITLLGTGADGVATILPLTHEGLYLVQVQSLPSFAGEIVAELDFEPQCYTLFDEWGQMVAHVGLGDIPNHEETVEALQRGAEDIRTGRSTDLVRRTGLAFSYDLFIPLPMPEGWMMGGHILSSQVFPQFRSFFIATLIPLVLWVLLLAVLIIYNIAQQRKKKKELYQVSRTDPLTKLANSTGMDAVLQRFFQNHPKQDYAMVCLDIVAFHRFNTMFDYATGDNLLRVISKALLDHYHCATRTSGDTFTFLARNQPDMLETVERTLYEEVRGELGRQYVQVVSFNFGVYPILDDNHTLREIYDGALLALKDAKRSPDRNSVIYDYELQQRADVQKEIEVNMLHALSREEFRLYVQPKFSTRDDNCCGGEVLVRWESEEMGFLAPTLFIPVFEANGFIVELDFYILDKTFALLQRQHDAGRPLFPLSVNQSPVTITFPNYLDRLSRLIKQYTVPLHYIQIEITENALVNDYALVLSLIDTYKEMGFAVAMDDFGTGYSSLNTLREIPVDILKIDKEFLRESNESERSRKIIRSIINMAVDLGISTVCEGVEEPAQYEFLKSSGCEIVQGFLFSRPVPGDDYVRDYLTGGDGRKTLLFPG